MKQPLLISFCILLFFQASAINKALIIGIDIYKPANTNTSNTTRSVWRNLNGCVNDAQAMKDIVMAKYGFASQNITELYNEQASRENILAQLNQLITTSQRDDIVFIYYAGHGSQMQNSLSSEKDKKDETIVPADAYKGVADIRDKELAVLFNLLLDKGVVLTVIFDSCHSGSAGRGQLFEITSTRYLEENTLDAKDPIEPLRPEDRGALILSAAQDFEFAKEIKDENNTIHGAFTLALLKAFQQTTATASAEMLFSSTQSIMKYFGKTQEPVIAGSETRRKANLFGIPQKALPDRLLIPVVKFEKGEVELMGGYALGIKEGVLLKNILSEDTLQVTQMLGVNKCLAKIISRRTVIAPGALFEIVSWSSSAAPALKIYIPEKGISSQGLSEAVHFFQALHKNKKLKLADDIADQKPQNFIGYADGKWWLQNIKGDRENIGLSGQLAAAKLPSATATFVHFPPPDSLLAAFRQELKPNGNIEIVSTPEESLYALTGTLQENGELAYAFVKTFHSSADSLQILPGKTSFETYSTSQSSANRVAEKLAENIFRIAKIRDWLLLQPPQGQNRFPFKLDIQYYRKGLKPLGSTVRLGDTLSFFFSKDSIGGSWNKKKRYIYVFAIDAKGAMKLLFPKASGGNVENRFPVTNAINSPEAKTHLLDILVRPPIGFDGYFMLTTEEAIGNLSAFQQPGVVSRGPVATELSNPLEALLFTGAKSRNKVTTPVNWSIDKIILSSTEKIKE